MPSISGAPSQLETPAPTSSPTKTETVNPTGTPTSKEMETKTPTMVTKTPTTVETTPPTMAPSGYVNSIHLPTIGIDVIVSDQDSASKSEEDLEADITAFIENFLETNSGVDSFDYVVLDFDVIRSSFDRRRLSTGLSIRIDGIVYFGSSPPSSEDLALDLRTYFSVWGIEDMENYLQAVGLPSSQIASVTVDGIAVKPSTSSTAGYNPGAKVQQLPPEEDDAASPTVIAGLAAACTVLAAVLVFLLLQNRAGSSWLSTRTTRSRANASISRDKPDEDAALTPKSSQTQSEQIPEGSDDISVGGGDCLSVDMSLYTTDESIRHVPTATKNSYSYDPKRLDRVIQMAKNQSNVSMERVAI